MGSPGTPVTASTRPPRKGPICRNLRAEKPSPSQDDFVGCCCWAKEAWARPTQTPAIAPNRANARGEVMEFKLKKRDMAGLRDRILQTFQAGIEVGGENNIKIHSPGALCAEFIHAAM